MRSNSLRIFALPALLSLSLHGLLLWRFFSFSALYKPPENGLLQGTTSSEITLVETDVVSEKKSVTPAEALLKSTSEEGTEMAQEKKVTADADASVSHQEMRQAASKRKATQNSYGHLGSSDVRPSYLNNPQPSYPQSEEQSGHEGVVLLHVFVSATGKVTQVTLEKSSGYPVLDIRAQETVEHSWRFGPAILNGKAIASEVLIPIHFSLAKAKISFLD